MTYPAKLVLIVAIVLAGLGLVAAGNPEVPGPSENLEEIRSCSLIIPLDSVYQNSSVGYQLYAFVTKKRKKKETIADTYRPSTVDMA
jgi:hypothetical protein